MERENEGLEKPRRRSGAAFYPSSLCDLRRGLEWYGHPENEG
jgi:hypothetical protein